MWLIWLLVIFTVVVLIPAWYCFRPMPTNVGDTYSSTIDRNDTVFPIVDRSHPTNPTGHYVYLHSIDDRVFYVGKGSTNRAWSTSSRNRYWWRWVNHHKPNNSIIENTELCRDNTDITVDIVADSLYPHQAYMLEEEVIDIYGVDNLTNILSSNAPAGERQYSKQPRLG